MIKTDRDLLRSALGAFDAFCQVGINEKTWGDKWLAVEEKMDDIRTALAQPDPGVTIAADRRNERVAKRYNELIHEGRHGHYESLFRVVREEVERAFEPRPIASAPIGPTLLVQDCNGQWRVGRVVEIDGERYCRCSRAYHDLAARWLPLPGAPE